MKVSPTKDSPMKVSPVSNHFNPGSFYHSLEVLRKERLQLIKDRFKEYDIIYEKTKADIEKTKSRYKEYFDLYRTTGTVISSRTTGTVISSNLRRSADVSTPNVTRTSRNVFDLFSGANSRRSPKLNQTLKNKSSANDVLDRTQAYMKRNQSKSSVCLDKYNSSNLSLIPDNKKQTTPNPSNGVFDKTTQAYIKSRYNRFSDQCSSSNQKLMPDDNKQESTPSALDKFNDVVDKTTQAHNEMNHSRYNRFSDQCSSSNQKLMPDDNKHESTPSALDKFNDVVDKTTQAHNEMNHSKYICFMDRCLSSSRKRSKLSR